MSKAKGIEEMHCENCDERIVRKIKTQKYCARCNAIVGKERDRLKREIARKIRLGVA